MIRTVWETAAESEKPVLLYGTGNGADKILDELARLHVRVSGVFASDGFVRNRTFRGFPVMSYCQAKERFGSFLILTAFGSSRPDVLRNIQRIAAEQELYAVDVPVAGDTIFNRAFYEAHLPEILQVQERLADEKSKMVYKNIVRFKLTGDIRLLLDCQTDRQEAFDTILRLNDHEIYMDLGAFNGDTAAEFLSQVPSYRKLYAVEADARNFRKLTQAVAGLPNTVCLHACIADFVGETRFSVQGGRGGRRGKSGAPVACETVDHILQGGEATLIKFDIEGLEAAALTGAAETIRTYRPKLIVSCYHRSQDIFALALQVMNIRSDYRIFMRHNPCIPAWDTQFYFV